MNIIYEIWHVQDFHNLDKEDIIYKKITGEPEESLEETLKLANKYIDHIEILIAVHGQKFMLGTYYDKLFIIKNDDNIKTYDGDEYYNMRHLPERIEKRKRIKKRKIIKENKRKYMVGCYGVLYILFIWLIFYGYKLYMYKNEHTLFEFSKNPENYQSSGSIQDNYLTENPQIRFFKINYKRHTNFALEKTHNNKKSDFGKTFTFSPLNKPTPYYINIQLPPIYHNNKTTKQCYLFDNI